MAFTTYTRTLDAEVLWYDTGITVQAGQQLLFAANGTVQPWPSWPNPGINPDGDPDWPSDPSTGVLLPNVRFCMLLGRIGSGGAPFAIGVEASIGGIETTDTLYLAINDVASGFHDNSGSFNVTIHVGVLGASEHEPGGDGTCYSGDNQAFAFSDLPLNLRTGEKREKVTDLSVMTPAGPLAFTRVYRQNKLNHASYQFMGRGWTHNHMATLTVSGTSPNRTAEVLLPGGGRLKLTEDSAQAGHFEAAMGSTSVLDYDSGANEYVLTAQDKSQLFFDDSNLRLKRRAWPNEENWTYSYDTNGRLTEVADTNYDLDPGAGVIHRKLQFVYIANTGQYDHEQLWRVGDHTAADLSTSTPTGRYVEFGYLPERLDGVLLSNPGALLATVKDVRGYTWTYHWYGQSSGEDDSDQQNLLLEVISPQADLDGDDLADSVITVKQLSYDLSGATITGMTQKFGIVGTAPPLLEAEYAFQPSGLSLTTEVIAAQETKYHFLGGVYAGPEDPAGNRQAQWLGLNYRLNTRKDERGNETRLRWDESGQRLLKVTDALDQSTEFDYNSNDTLNFSIDPRGQKTEYIYGDSNHPRLPTDIQVFSVNGLTTLRHQSFVYNSQGQVISETLIDPEDGMTVLQQVRRTYHDSGLGNGLLHTLTQEDIGGTEDVTTTYSYDEAGRVVKTQRSSNFGTCEISYTVYDTAGNVVATICNYAPGMNPDPTSAAEAVALYDEQSPDINQVTTHEYDALGRRIKTTINAGANFAQTIVTLYDALDRVWRTIANYAVQGSSAPGDWVWDVSDARWEDGSGNPINHGTENTQNQISDTAFNERGQVRLQRDTMGNVTLYGYDDAGRLVKTVQSASDAGYDNSYGVSGDPDLSAYVASSDADQDIVTLNEYDPAGNLVKTTDPLGQASFTVYDALNRPVKTVRSAQAAATLALNPGDVGYSADNDPRAAGYVPSLDPDRDLIETTEYDALGRVIRTQRLLENRGSSALWDTTLYGYDVLGRQIKVIRSASNPHYDIAADPDLSGYTVSSTADQDIVTQTVYEDSGRTLYTQDVLGNRTWFTYDGLGRQVKTITNAVGTAIDGGSSDPRSSSYTPSGEPDKDLIALTVYDADGRVLETEDMLGRVTRQVYDSLGRQVRTVTNYVDNSYNPPSQWVRESGVWRDAPSGTAISHGTNNDQNQVSSTEYDDQGRVWKTFDHRNNETRFVYDLLGRRVLTIANYVAQGISDPVDWVWDATDDRWEDGAGNAIDHGSANDQNQITTTSYDIAGRVTATRDALGVETRYEYDRLGRRVKTIVNYVDGVFNPTAPDEDLVSLTVYNKGGQVVSTTDPRGTQTAFAYDAAGRRLIVTQAAATPLATTSYTGYDKAGRVRRSIQNYSPLYDEQEQEISPDAYENEAWLFNPTQHGPYQDQNLITEYQHDRLGRVVQVTDPVGNATQTDYFKDGTIQAVTDAEGVETAYRYDKLRRRVRVVQGFVENGEDPEAWVWDGGQSRWERSSGAAITHGTANDQNIIVDVTYDKAGRMVALRNPRGYLTTYSYDQLNRRLSLTNPLSQTWATAYSDLASGGTQVNMTYPGLTSGSYMVARVFDRLGRLSSIDYDDPTTTPNVDFAYDVGGNRARMTEYSGANFTTPIRETVYGYDATRRLTSVGFDTDGDSNVEETVSYQYDAGGLRTKLTLPGNLEIVYVYDAKGQLIRLTDWDSQPTTLAYDQAGRHIATTRANGLRSRYSYDAASRLRKLRHSSRQQTLAQFEYEVDRRGNRTKALEVLPYPATTNDTTLAFDAPEIVYTGDWTDSSPFKRSDSPGAALKTLVYGRQIAFTFGTGPDHGLFDVYIGKTLYRSYDGFAMTSGERTENVTLDGEGPFLFEIRNRAERNTAGSGYRVRFRQLVVSDAAYDARTLTYEYDALQRLLAATTYPGTNIAATPLRAEVFSYDRAGNRLSASLALNGGTPTVTNYSYNAANQMTSDGTNTLAYDANGNLVTRVQAGFTYLTQSWDRANRLVGYAPDHPLISGLTSHGYTYDGLGHRIAQVQSGQIVTETDYLLDVQPGLAVVLAETSGGNTTRYIHAPRGIHAQEASSGIWTWPLQDGLGSVRSVASNTLAVNGMRHYAAYGTPIGGQGSLGIPFGFTGEQTDGNGLVYLRARHYAPSLGIFPSLDPFEGVMDRPMSLNGYSYVEGDPVNMVDPSGEQSQCSDPIICNLISPYDYALRVALGCDVMPTPGQVAYQAFAGRALSSSVTFALIRRAFGCNSLDDVWKDRKKREGNCVREGLSIGTIIDEGIITHNHLNGGNSSFTISVQAFNSYDWIFIDGALQTDIIPTNQVSLSELVAGTVLLQLPYSASSFGAPATRSPVNLSSGEVVWFVYYPFNNGDWYNVWGGYPPHDSLRVNASLYWKQSRSTSGGSDHVLHGPSRVDRGDSGGGHFNGGGNLIGVLDGERGELADWSSTPIIGGLAYYAHAWVQAFTAVM